jgi:putative copper export protein/mono/diheme cytochrome c family protein
LETVLGDGLLAIRTLHFASAALLCGLTLFLLFVAEPAFRRAAPVPALAQLNRQFCVLAWSALAVAILTGTAWLAVLSARMSGEPLGDMDAIPSVLTGTTFGRVWLIRLGLVVLIAALLLRFDPAQGWRTRAESAVGGLLGAAYIAGLAWAGHGAAGSLLQSLGDAAHLVAAGGWLGGLIPFVMVMARAHSGRSRADALLATEVTARFSTLGIVIVAILVVSGTLNSWYLVGDVPHLVGTDYGRLLLIKIVLFVAMVAIAAVNRFVLMPRLRHADAPIEATLRVLERNGALEIALGLAIIAVVGALGTMVPAIHDQPSWPFSIRITFAAFSEATEWLNVLIAVEACAVAIVAIVLGIFTHRLRWPLFVAGGLALIWFAPRLMALTAPAFPTTFFTSPTGYTVQSIAAGAELYAQHCAGCHGPHGRGDGVRARDLLPPPPDLTTFQVHAQLDGNLYWWITHGVGAMPAFPAGPGDISPWSLIDFIHANADAQRLVRPGDHIFPAPDFSVQCSDGSSPSLAELRGRVVHVVIAGSATAARLQQLASMPLSGVQTVVVATDRGLTESDGFCATADLDTAHAFALYRGVPIAQLEDTEFLIDTSGWLREMWYPGRQPDWTQPVVLRDELELILRHPAAGSPAAGHVH